MISLRWLLHRWHLKLIALVLAYTTWLVIVSENRILQDFTVPIDVSLPEDAILTGPRSTRVTVRLRGPRALMRGIDPLRLEVQVDLRDALPGERNVQLESDYVQGVPVGVEVDQIEPRRINLTVSRRVRRELPVVPFLLGEPAEGFAFYAHHVVPETVTVEGPEDEVAAMSRLRTDPIRIDGHRGPLRVQVAAVPDSPEVRVVDPRDLQVRIEIDESPVESKFEDVPVVLAGQVFEANVNPETITITLSGPPHLLRRLQPEQLRAVVDVSELTPRSRAYSLSPRLEFVDVHARDLTRLTEKSPGRKKVSVRLLDRRISE